MSRATRSVGGSRDNINASEKETRCADADKDCQQANYRKDTHVSLQRKVR